ncbi:Hypothetical predicted protein [Paramuricea clavata]|uniref:Uncharacterized protein n=1 Tax=Paramuricea clavata TaxID=317549 RepID=A0A7D9EYA5_PARCT|nr:Hypothetical predicted protein [Paramuricea clavata]
MPLTDVKESFVGCVLEIRWKCKAGHCGEWKSSKMVKKVPVVAGDRQMDSPGFSAKNCVYTLMHEELDYVLHVEVVDVCHAQLKSVVMEKVGLVRQKKNEILKAWVAPIQNHFWHCVKNCGGDLKNLKTDWVHVLKHVANIHSWYNGQCSHGPLDDVSEREWINKDSAPMQALRNIVLNKKFLKSLPFYTRFRYEGLKARSILAAIDHNHHLHRKQARNSKGELVYSRRWSKSVLKDGRLLSSKRRRILVTFLSWRLVY